MGIPNETVTQNEIEEKRRQERAEEAKERQRRKVEQSLEEGPAPTASRAGAKAIG